MDDSCMKILNDVQYISELRNNLIFLGTLYENGFSYMSNGDRDIMKVKKGILYVMRANRITYNIYKLLGNNVIGDVASIEFDNDASKP